MPCVTASWREGCPPIWPPAPAKLNTAHLLTPDITWYVMAHLPSDKQLSEFLHTNFTIFFFYIHSLYDCIIEK